MKKWKKLISMGMTLVMLLSIGLTAYAESPTAGNTLYVNTRDYAVNSSTSSNYRQDTGSAYNFLRIREYDENPCYCIQKGGEFTRTLYKTQSLSSSPYWKGLSATAREGIALVVAFGYPAQTPAQLGVPKADDAYVATQALIWEYQQGFRTSPTKLSDTRHKKTVVGTPAEKAYNKILENISAYSSDPRYKSDIQSIAGFVQLTSASTSEEQEIICFYGKTPELKAVGSIEIFKKDSAGKELDGAQFTIYDSTNTPKYTLTTKNGTCKVTDIPFGKYTVVETKFPSGYTDNGKKTYSVTLNESTPNLTVTINAVNVQKKFKVSAEKKDAKTQTAQGDATLAGAVYGLYNGTKLVESYTTDKNGKFTTNTFVCGDNWHIKEISPSPGYLLNETDYKIPSVEDFSIELTTVEMTLKETVKTGKFSIIKHSDDGKTQIETPEPGVEFEVYLKSAGSYDTILGLNKTQMDKVNKLRQIAGLKQI